MRSLAVLTLLVTLTATGCGQESTGADAAEASDTAGSSSSATETPTDEQTSASPEPKPVEPADGRTFRLDGLRVTVPKRWSDVGERPTDDTVLAVMHTGVDDTPERLYVRRLDGSPSRAAATREASQWLTDIGAQKVTADGTVEVAGRQATLTTARRSRGGVDERFHQYVLADQGATWVLTFSVNRWQQRPDPQRVIDSVLMTVRLS